MLSNFQVSVVPGLNHGFPLFFFSIGAVRDVWPRSFSKFLRVLANYVWLDARFGRKKRHVAEL